MSKKQYIGYGAVFLFALVVIFLFGIRGMRPFLVPSSSMEPTLLPSDYIFAVKEGTYMRGDIVVLTDPLDPESFMVKRIVGVPGDTIEIQGGALLIDGEYASEPYIKEPMEFGFGPLEVQAGEIFVLGDNRNESEDCARWGKAIPASLLTGRVAFIYNPVSRMGVVKSYPLTTTNLE